MVEPPSSPPSEAASAEDALAWYKAQYELLESELVEFRESSRELERELEKDIERAEKQERVLQERAETLGFEVEEWKRKYKESKTEAGAAQASLEKEITTLRESNRSLTLRLRDSEVANDDFERQARNTTSSLEDMESKFNQAVERAVLMEEEIRLGEQERERIRIDSQRVREELAELKIEADLMQDKIKKHESRHLSTISSDMSIVESPTFDKHVDASPDSTASSPLISTPLESKTLEEPTAELLDPPSPPMSDASAPVPRLSRVKTPAPGTAGFRKSRLPSMDVGATPKPRGFKSSTSGSRIVTGGTRPSGGVSLRTSANKTPANKATNPRLTNHKNPASNSLSHIRTLTAQMQRLEARVQSVRSKLPAPAHTPPRPSPRPLSGASGVPSSVTIRSRKRTTTGSTASSSAAGDDTTPTSHYTSTTKSNHVPRLSTSGVSRLSFGPLPNRGPESETSRPSSRASASSYARPASRTEMVAPPRPMSRSSFSGARTPLGRPPSALSSSLHGHSASLGGMDLEEEYEGEIRTPSRRGTYSRFEIEGSITRIPTPGPRRQSGSRRTSVGGAPIHSGRTSTTGIRKLGDLGETY